MMKDMHLDPRFREAIRSSQKKSVVLFGVAPSAQFDAGDSVRIFAGSEPLAEGIIRSVMVTNIGNLINHVLETNPKGNTTREGVLAALNDHFKGRIGRDIKSKDSITVVEWEYSKPADPA